MQIIHISAECYPVAKVGGLADVVGSLPKYQNKLGYTSAVIMPYYKNKFVEQNSFKTIYESTVALGVYKLNFSIRMLANNPLDFDVYFVDVPELLYKDYVYSANDTDRFIAFQIAALDWILTLDKKPEIIHCHDHHTGLIPFMLQECHNYKSLNKIPVVTTIHNAQYQGWFSHEKVDLIPEFDFHNVGLLDWGSSINPLAAAIKCAWSVTTVSPSYMEELQLEANGLEGLLSAERSKSVGILNGIDAKVWNPETDTYIVQNYTEKTVAAGRQANKAWLCKEFNLDIEKPLFAFIGRLVGEKGADLLPEAIFKALKSNEINVLVLGSGQSEIESALFGLIELYPGAYNAFIGYDEKLSHIIYAGADFLLMPSRVEPCGLNQMYALRYGTIPIVRSIGGLKDTITDITEADGFGICHQEVNVDEMINAIERGTALYKTKTKFIKIRRYIMGIDHSWDASALQYINLYKALNNQL
ncbi:glycogen synthase [Cellulophaga sp. F20128]|uniref:glycogen synthase n=1 Tax=Cellulophaga sp. F20128 TaxID=2926413 RepID=UPI001FF494CA|nr:glycogen/starch synthase [Cellulophaga sp. F20128]MCK0155942.1 glycogen synthase [Cellulophaga sp. F20128]